MFVISCQQILIYIKKKEEEKNSMALGRIDIFLSSFFHYHTLIIKSVKFEFILRSGNGQGILILVREICNSSKSQGILLSQMRGNPVLPYLHI